MLLEDKTQPVHDTEIVPKAMMDDLEKGLLALGTYPRKRFQRLTITFAAYPENDKVSAGGIKYLDTKKMAGPIPAIIADTVAVVRRNTRLGSAMVGAAGFGVSAVRAVATRR